MRLRQFILSTDAIYKEEIPIPRNRPSSHPKSALKHTHTVPHNAHLCLKAFGTPTDASKTISDATTDSWGPMAAYITNLTNPEYGRLCTQPVTKNIHNEQIGHEVGAT